MVLASPGPLPIIDVRVGGGRKWRTCAARDNKQRPVKNYVPYWTNKIHHHHHQNVATTSITMIVKIDIDNRLLLL